MINAKLRELESAIIDQWNYDIINKANITKNWLKNVIEVFSGKVTKNEMHKVYFVNWIDLFIENAPKRLHKGKAISLKTIQQYSVTLKKIKEFEKFNDLKLRFEDIDLKFYRDFVFFCRNNQSLADNSINGHIKNIKLFCKNIEIEGLPINLQYKHSEFTGFVTNTENIYFNDLEIDQIFTHDFSDNERLSNARDLFIIGLRTGLRVSDFLRLQKPNLKDKLIIIETSKTREVATIPMHPQIEKILSSRKGEFPRNISEQKFNLYIKEICNIIGFNQAIEGSLINPKTKRKEKGVYEKWQLVSSHICRRSFATNLYGKLPNKVIMSITTHKSESQFLAYIKTTKTEYAKILGDYWENQEKTSLQHG